MEKEKIYKELTYMLTSSVIKKDELLGDYTYTKTGGIADILVFPESYDDTQKLLSFASEKNIPVTILGNASNVIVKDGGIRGIVISLLKLNKIVVQGTLITAQSGASIIDTSRFAYKHGLSGLEFACGIPGTVGGAIYMNAGAYGGEVSTVFVNAIVLTKKGELLDLRKEDIDMGYRTSSIATEELIVLEATFSLVEANTEMIKEKMIYLTHMRELKQPLEYPSCGSVFKRPPGNYAGKLIQDSGMQGKQIGGAQVSEKHAGFIVNLGKATSTDYINLIQRVQTTVKERFDIQLETEVKIIGED